MRPVFFSNKIRICCTKSHVTNAHFEDITSSFDKIFMLCILHQSELLSCYLCLKSIITVKEYLSCPCLFRNNDLDSKVHFRLHPYLFEVLSSFELTYVLNLCKHSFQRKFFVSAVRSFCFKDLKFPRC